jgi:ABC-2 type transport system permease protein
MKPMEGKMKTMQWLIRREYWEHKGMLLWVPLAIAALMLTFALAMAAMGHNAEIHLDMPEGKASGITIQMGARQQQALADVAATTYPMAAAPLYLTLAFMVFSYSIGALYNERRDRSLLFWKSLPVSDTATVLSKAALALLLIPLGVVVLALATALLITLVGLAVLAYKGTNVFPLLLASPHFWLTPLKLLALIPVYMLWALPTVGWLLMVSGWARSKAFLWAVGTPLVTALLLSWANKAFALGWHMEWLFTNFISRLLVSVVPGSWFAIEGLRRPVEYAGAVAERGPTAGVHGVVDALFNGSWAAVATPHLWIGAIAGVLMIATAIWLRRRREEG